MSCPVKCARSDGERQPRWGATCRHSEAGVEFRSGMSWTIDTPYRETVAEARHYQAEGVLCVEMEAAALFAVGEVRDVRVAAAFTISDSLADLVWDPQFHGAEVEAALLDLYQAALRTLTAPKAA
jgi:purine-nucleoside phosphorylase